MYEFWSNDWYRTSRGLCVAIPADQQPDDLPDPTTLVSQHVKVNSIVRVVEGVEWGSNRGFGLMVKNLV